MTGAVATWAILLGGGRSARMGRDKLSLTLAGDTLAARGVRALLEVAASVVFVSPERPEVMGPGVVFALEDPPFGGPVAGIAAGLELIDDDDAAEVYVLAGDLAAPEGVVGLLRGQGFAQDGVALVDAEGWVQYLAGRYRLGALRSLLAGEVRDRSVRRTFAVARLSLVAAGPAVTTDLDTPEQARHAGFH